MLSIDLSVVVLPAPLRPIKPMMRPRSSEKPTSLSRNAGASSAAILAQVRCNIYAISAANELSIGMEGASGRLIQEDQLNLMLSSIDNYLAFLTTGMDTGEYQTNLQNSLDALLLQINALE